MELSVTCDFEHYSKNNFLLSTETRTLIQGQIKGECVFTSFLVHGLEVFSASLTLYLVTSVPIPRIWKYVVDDLKFQHDKGVVTSL